MMCTFVSNCAVVGINVVELSVFDRNGNFATCPKNLVTALDQNLAKLTQSTTPNSNENRTYYDVFVCSGLPR